MISKSEREQIIALIKKEVVPAIGCTEPIAVALCVAKATETLGERPKKISVLLSANILKNAMGVGIPGTGMIGLPIAIALGAIIGKSEYQLEVLKDCTPEAVEEGKKLLERQRDEIIKKIRKELPYFIRRFTGIQRLSRKLGFKDIDLKDSYFPTYTFRCISKYGKITGAFDVVFDLKELEEFIKYLLQKIKFKKSVAGQRALMTPKLREKIKERDGYTCQICGLSNKDEPNLLLEIDHIIPLSKGGMTTEGNLQILCWRCNRSKGAKI